MLKPLKLNQRQIEVADEAQIIIKKAFSEIRSLGVKVTIPRQGYITLNPVDFEYYVPPTLEEINEV